MGVNGKFWAVESNDPCLMIYIKLFFVSVAHLLHTPGLHEWSVWFLVQWYGRKWKEYLRQVLCHVLFSLPFFPHFQLPLPSCIFFLFPFLSYFSLLSIPLSQFLFMSLSGVLKLFFYFFYHPKQRNQTLFLSKDHSLPKIFERIRKREIERSLLLFTLIFK